MKTNDMELENCRWISEKQAHRIRVGLFVFVRKEGWKMTRREEREQAFCILFEQAVTGESVENILHAAAEAREFVSDPSGEEDRIWSLPPSAFAEAEAFGAEEHLEELDRVIGSNIKGWNIRRLSKVTLALLRLAAYEILFDASIPESVTINEAVELAKTYGSTDDSSYINGVLASVVKGRAKPEEQQ